MKGKTLVALIALSLSGLAYGHHDPQPDTLTVHTQYGPIYYSGNITQLDTEDSIKQIEINDATVNESGYSYDAYLADHIFTNGFEQGYNVNWIWVGDDTHGVEFGGVGQCTETYHQDSDGSQHVELFCHQINNEQTIING